MSAKYKRIAQELRNQILLAKSIKPYKLPTEQELCNIYQVSRQTVRQALKTLEEDNLITRRQGSGAYTVPQIDLLRRKKIVLLISEDSVYTYPKFIADIKAGLRVHNLTLEVHITHNDINIERKILENLLEDSISILIVEGVQSAFPNPNLDLYEKMQLEGTSIIFVSHWYPQLANTRKILSDDSLGGYLLGSHLIANRYGNSAAILPDFAQNAKDRYYGLQLAYRNHQLPMPSHNIFWYSESELRSLRSRQDTGFLAEFVRTTASKYNSVLCYSDEITYWLLKELSYAGISVPEQLAVASFDNSYLCTLGKPSITSLALPPREPADSICNIVTDILHNESSKSDTGNTMQNKILPWELISRGST